MCGLIFAACQADSEICNSDIGKNSRNLHCGAIAKKVLAKLVSVLTLEDSVAAATARVVTATVGE